MSVRGLLAILWLLSVAAVGCDRGSAPPPPSTTRQPGTTVVVGGVSPLARRGEPLPELVARQADFFSGGDQGCVGREDGPPPLRIHLDHVAIVSPSMFLVCFLGFAKGRALTLEVARPDGVVRRFVRPRYNGGGVRVPVLPGAPFGRYVLRVRQGEATSSVTATVVPAREPTVMLIGATSSPRLGEPVRLALGGFPPNAPARMHAYVRDDLSQSAGQYVTSFEVPTDRHGQGRLTIPTRAGDLGGCYGLLWARLRQVYHLFCFAPRAGADSLVAGGAPGTAPVTVGMGGEIIVRDDFSRRGLWAEGSAGQLASGYADGQYRLLVGGPHSGVHIDAPRSPADQAGSARVEVDATRVSSSRALFGVTCRENPGGPGVGGFYLGAVDARGSWSIARVIIGGGLFFSFQPGVPSPARTLARAERRSQYNRMIRPSGTNRVGLECKGGTSAGAPVSLLLYVNGYQVAKARDPRGLGPGRGGLWVQSSEEPAEVRFDNYAVRRP